MWIAKITYEGVSGIEHEYVTAPMITRLYTKLYKSLHLKWLECHIYQEIKK
jgi:hypothetical protein